MKKYVKAVPAYVKHVFLINNVHRALKDTFCKIKEIKEATNVINAIKNVKHVKIIKKNAHHVLMVINLKVGNANRILKFK